MLLTLSELHARVETALPSLLDQLSELTGRGGASERHAWQRSLPKLVAALSAAEIGSLHVHFARRAHHVALEYQLPGASAWCDVVLLGRHEGRPSAVVIELKDWDTTSDRPGRTEGLIERRGVQELHPSDQVRGYVEYCRRFHSAVLDQQALVHGFVLFTTGFMKHPYLMTPNAELAANFPIFTTAQKDLSEELPRFLRSKVSESDVEFATDFATGTFRQDRGFMQQIGRTIITGDTRHFELLDNQRRALNLCVAKARDALKGGGKRVVLVIGPPGSGKSAVAARLWATLVTDEEVPEGNVVLVTTSQSQNSNWTYLIDAATRARTGRGVARKATSFSPIDIPQLSRLRTEAGDRLLYRNGANWRGHLADLSCRGVMPKPGAETDSCLISLVDEAHALINTEREHGVGQYGFATGLGPQAFHIIRCSRIAVFFIDPDQSFRARENTSISDIEGWAAELGATTEHVSLEGVQFRCAGSAEYVAWVEALLGGGSEASNAVFASAWFAEPEAASRTSGNVVAFRRKAIRDSTILETYKVAEGGGRYSRTSQGPRFRMDFRVYDDPFELESDLRKQLSNWTARLVSTYCREWRSEGASFPHELPPEAQDFCETVNSGGASRVWARPWNFVPNGDYTGFVTGREGFPIHADPLCEVGCTYAVRGFDFDYLGLLWLDDLVWRDGSWKVQLAHVHESGISRLVQRARHEGDIAPAGPHGASVLEKVRQAYRILLTRATRGLYVWIPDIETREHVLRSLGSAEVSEA